MTEEPKASHVSIETTDGVVTLSGNPEWVKKFADRFYPELLIGMDIEEWPDGHPCRVCGALFKDHPSVDCEAWG